jgi:hypothetical protein
MLVPESAVVILRGVDDLETLEVIAIGREWH